MVKLNETLEEIDAKYTQIIQWGIEMFVKSKPAMTELNYEEGGGKKRRMKCCKNKVTRILREEGIIK